MAAEFINSMDAFRIVVVSVVAVLVLLPSIFPSRFKL